MRIDRLVVASKNPDKIAEVEAVLRSASLVGEIVRGLDWPDVDEEAETLEGNALLKARAVAAETGLPAVADDTGLFVARPRRCAGHLRRPVRRTRRNLRRQRAVAPRPDGGSRRSCRRVPDRRRPGLAARRPGQRARRGHRGVRGSDGHHHRRTSRGERIRLRPHLRSRWPDTRRDPTCREEPDESSRSSAGCPRGGAPGSSGRLNVAAGPGRIDRPESPGQNHQARITRAESPGQNHIVGLAGFEPATPCSQSRCATKLRHSPEADWCEAPLCQLAGTKGKSSLSGKQLVTPLRHR